MSDAKRQPLNDSSFARCTLCGEEREDVHVDVCVGCVERTLRRHLPLLKRTLEERFGRNLDSWLERGCFFGTAWAVSPKFEITQERLRSFIAGVIAESLRKEAIALVLPQSGGWVPVAAGELADLLYEQCGDEFRRLATEFFTRFICRAPTKAVERELIEVATGDRLTSGRHREYAVELAAFTTGSPLPPSAAVLLTLCYGANSFKRLYAGFWEGEIDPVWRSCAASLPPEIARLIPEGESDWL